MNAILIIPSRLPRGPKEDRKCCSADPPGLLANKEPSNPQTLKPLTPQPKINGLYIHIKFLSFPPRLQALQTLFLSPQTPILHSAPHSSSVAPDPAPSWPP